MGKERLPRLLVCVGLSCLALASLLGIGCQKAEEAKQGVAPNVAVREVTSVAGGAYMEEDGVWVMLGGYVEQQSFSQSGFRVLFFIANGSGEPRQVNTTFVIRRYGEEYAPYKVEFVGHRPPQEWYTMGPDEPAFSGFLFFEVPPTDELLIRWKQVNYFVRLYKSTL